MTARDQEEVGRRAHALKSAICPVSDPWRSASWERIHTTGETFARSAAVVTPRP